MYEWITVVITVVIGALIGGLTNQLAVRMLFRPYTPWMLGRWRVPFTPGLIPRRRSELGQQMGNLVENYLLTAEGLQRAIAAGGIQEALTRWLTGYVEQLMASRQTLRDVLAGVAPGVLGEDGGWSARARQLAENRWHQWSGEWLDRAREMRIRQLLPAEVESKLDEACHVLAQQLLTRFGDYLRSPAGVEQLQVMLRSFMGGGMFGGLVGMFLGDDKLIAKVLPHIDEILQDPQVAGKLADVMRQEADKLLDKQLSELLDWIGEGQWRVLGSRLFAHLEKESVRLLDKPLADFLGPLHELMGKEWISRLAAWVVQALAANVERLFHRLEIARIVARQVEGFPLARVEEMVIGISGKEFRMITLLGFLLGGMIGLVQGLLHLVL
ncbi:MAG: DUF445 family protein [Brevibacillus sp.]|nr:DUF445 family protein [Brevibacillus sp.]